MIHGRTGHADFQTAEMITIEATAREHGGGSEQFHLERKSLKVSMHGYRNPGIFYENAVNKILADIVKACQPVSATVIGEFTARDGLSSTIEASHP